MTPLDSYQVCITKAVFREYYLEKLSDVTPGVFRVEFTDGRRAGEAVLGPSPERALSHRIH